MTSCAWRPENRLKTQHTNEPKTCQKGHENSLKIAQKLSRLRQHINYAKMSKKKTNKKGQKQPQNNPKAANKQTKKAHKTTAPKLLQNVSKKDQKQPQNGPKRGTQMGQIINTPEKQHTNVPKCPYEEYNNML